jgi:hypothetical protein
MGISILNPDKHLSGILMSNIQTVNGIQPNLGSGSRLNNFKTLISLSANLQIKALLVEKTVIAELGESHPW